MATSGLKGCKSKVIGRKSAWLKPPLFSLFSINPEMGPQMRTRITIKKSTVAICSVLSGQIH